MHIGILEDDVDQGKLLELIVVSGQHTTRCFNEASEFLNSLGSEHYDLLVIDWMLPDDSGSNVLQWIRQNLGAEVAVVVVTACEDEDTVVTALRVGADDYVVKPPKPLELLARLDNAARRVRPRGLPPLRMGRYQVDVMRHCIALDGAPVTLTQKEFELSVYLFQNPGKLLSRDHLLNRIWGMNCDVDTRTVDTHISRLRKKLIFDGSTGWKLNPVYGYGYRFDRTDQPA